MKKLDLKEFDRFEGLLKMNKIKYERHDNYGRFHEFHGIFYPSKGWHTADAIICSNSVGHEKGLLEQWGLIPDNSKGILGYQTADEVFRRWEEHFNGQRDAEAVL